MMTFFGMLKACGNMGKLIVHTKMKLDFVMDGGVVRYIGFNSCTISMECIVL